MSIEDLKVRANRLSYHSWFSLLLAGVHTKDKNLDKVFADMPSKDILKVIDKCFTCEVIYFINDTERSKDYTEGNIIELFRIAKNELNKRL